MGIYPKKYTKEEFIEFLQKINTSETIINKFNELPNSVERGGIIFNLDINTIWYNEGQTHYSFELNYYSNDLVEYLFNSKVFNDVELSINYLICELMTKNHIKKNN